MGVSTETIRRITIQGQGQESLDSLAASVDKVTAAEGRLATASTTTATVTDMATKRQLSAADAYKRQTLSVVDGARAQDQFMRASKVADAALQQGVITAGQHADRISLLKEKYNGATGGLKEFSAGLGDGIALLGQFGIAVGVGEVIAFGHEVFGLAASLDHQAIVAGVSVEALQAYRHAVVDGGGSVDEADQIVRRFTRSIGDATAVVGPARDAFFDLSTTGKLAFSDLKLGAETVLPQVAQSLLAIQDPSRRARDEVALFGKVGQEIEPALRRFAEGTATLEDRLRLLGGMMDPEVAQKAHDASVKMDDAWNRLSVAAAGPVVALTNGLTGLLTQLEQISARDWVITIAMGPLGPVYSGIHWVYDQMHGLLTAPTPDAGSDVHLNPIKLGGAFSPAQTATPFAQFGIGSSNSAANDSGGTGLSHPLVDEIVAKSQQTANLAGETANQHARSLALITAGEAALKEMGDTQSKILTTSDAIAALERDFGKAKAADVIKTIDAGANLKQQATVHDHIKETFAGYLSLLDQAAVAAGLSADERAREAAIIKGAQIGEKAHGVAAKDLSQTYANAVTHLSAAQVVAIQNRLVLADTNAVQRDLTDQIARAQSLGASSLADRAVETQYLTLEAKYGKQVADAARDQLGTLQAISDLTAARDQVNARDTDIARLHSLQALRGKPGIDQGRVTEAANDNPISRAGATLDQSFGSNPFGPGAGLAARSTQASIGADATARTNTANDTYAVSRKTIQDQQDLQNRLLAIEQDRYAKSLEETRVYEDAKLALGETTFAGLATGLGDMFGRQSAAYKVAFAIEKAFAIARTTLAIETAVAQAMAIPWPANIPAIAQAVALGGTLLSEIASVKTAGFMAGGYTGDMGTSQVAGFVHGKEFVVNAAGTANNRSLLEGINRGQPANGNRPLNINVRQEPGVAIEYVGMTADGVELIARRVVKTDTQDVVAAGFHNRNSPIAKARRATQQRT